LLGVLFYAMAEKPDCEPTRILQPLSLNSLTGGTHSSKDEEGTTIPCFFCEETFPATENGTKNPILAHLLSEHKLIIANVDKVANFPKYVTYWREKLSQTKDIKDYCVVINTNTAPDDKAPQEKFFMLTDFLPEDKALRDDLNNAKLSAILDEQLVERKDQNFSRRCLFCKIMFHGNRSQLFLHMAKDHSFNVGNPDNIVHSGEFLDLIKSKLDSFVCLFCEKGFKEWNVLKDHMRKKSHKRIDPKNKKYDRFYLINYLDPGKDWKEVQLEPEYEKEVVQEEEDEDIEKEWEDWIEEDALISFCLFCSHVDDDVNNIVKHMKEDHDFDINSIKEKMNLTFYHQVKIVNFIRKQIYELKCPSCLLEYKSKGDLQEHLKSEKHYNIPEDKSVWDQPGYFFPTFDDDTLLCFLNDDDLADENHNKSRSQTTAN